MWTDPQVRRAIQRVVPWRLDVTAADDQADGRLALLRVRRVPTVVLLTASGTELARAEGSIDRDAVLSLLARAAPE